MSTYDPPIDDMRFLLADVFKFDGAMEEIGHAGMDTDLAVEILNMGGKFCSEILAPLNRVGDEVGSRLEGGIVHTPPGFAQAYKDFTAGGWTGLSAPSAFGGQELPKTIDALFDEMVSAANVSFGLFPGLTRGAVEALLHHASDDLKSTYVPRMVSGEWTGAMALTESSAGTDLGLLKTRAEPQGDGSCKITGTKIFISSGDHDFGGNVIHLVLARLPDAPVGVKGISLFLVPKILVDENGELGASNALSVGALEHKMGIHAQPTCVMNYDGAIGWIVGSPGRGLNAMFTMMNAERLFVGIQGLGIGDAAYQKARNYARERLQGRSADGAPGPVAIIQHPDVRKMLMTIRSLNEAGRGLAVWTAMQMDYSTRHPDEKARQSAAEMVALLTPVVKAALTDFGFESAVMAQQVFGGHGYIAEWGVEQYVRDARITQIYEGTNGVQALDLVARKLVLDRGAAFWRFLDLARADLADARKAREIADIVDASEAALERLAETTRLILERADEPGWVGAAATDYLRLFALTSYGWLWARMAAAAAQRGSDPVSVQKIKLARFFTARILPQTLALAASVSAGPDTILEPEDAEV
jgi:alkylation response protein AidB-like acyl-CoA dehydrogenase